jgi:phytoene/squalene synthetase
MTKKDLFDQVSMNCSRITTRSYSTSFSLGIRFLNKRFHDPIYAVYGFVRFADEIVDTFHEYDKATLLATFKADTYQALDNGISLNPILHRFQLTYNQFNVKPSYYKKAIDGKFDIEAAKKEYEETYKKISLKMTQTEFQREVGRLEVLGELIIKQK